MKRFAQLSFAAMTLVSAQAFASTQQTVQEPKAFRCPTEASFLSAWSAAVSDAKPEDKADLVATDRAVAYDKFFPSNIPNHELLFNSAVADGVEYDITLVRDDFLWNPEYPDAYGVLFKKGTSIALATISTDTDRADYQCKPLLAPTLVLSEAEFLNLTIDSPQDITVEIKGVVYQHFYVISQNLAYGETESNEFVQFVPAK